MKDPRYDTIKGLLKAGEIKEFTEIFKWIPYTVVAGDFGTNNNRMKKMKADSSLWTLEEVYHLAELIGCDKKMLALMAVEQVERMKGEQAGDDLTEDK
jgi:hypothetical protein